jgi:hypothetical protein
MTLKNRPDNNDARKRVSMLVVKQQGKRAVSLTVRKGMRRKDEGGRTNKVELSKRRVVESN